jgi:hypothetical protein
LVPPAFFAAAAAAAPAFFAVKSGSMKFELALSTAMTASAAP